jgi:hypothetical protein
MNTFNLPSVDHLIEGVHYTVVDWSFAEGRIMRDQATNMPSKGGPSMFAEECGPDEKMIFGMCRKVKGSGARDDKDFDSSKKSKQEEEGEAQAKKQGSEFKNNKMVKDIKTGKKMGWAMKDGKPVLVAWGSVAGKAKVGPKKPKTPAPAPSGASRTGVTDSTRQGQRQGNDSARGQQVNLAGLNAQDQNRRSIESQTRSS